jgi:hypothetical protein
MTATAAVLPITRFRNKEEGKMPIRLTVLAVALLLGLAGCGGSSIEPQYVTFDYRSKTMSETEATAISNALETGQRSLPDTVLFGSESCQFTSNAETGRLELAINGNPVGSTANLVLRADNDTARPTNVCPAAVSPTPRDVAIQTSNNVRLGQAVVNSGEATLTINGERFSSSGLYMRFELTGLSGDYGVGRFEFLARNIDDPSDSRVIVVSNGNFAVED